MKVKKIVRLGSVCIGVSVLFTSCLSLLLGGFSDTTETKKKTNNVVVLPDTKVYEAGGESPSLLTAISKAKVSAIRQGVTDIIGVYAEQNNQQKLNEILYNTEYPNAFVVNDKMEELQKYKTGDNYFIEISIPVKMKELASFLKANGIRAENDTVETKSDKSVNPPVPNPPYDTFGNKKTGEEQKKNAAYLARYLDTMTYMVYGAENSKTEPFLLKSAVEMANAYLIQNGNRVVDFNKIERLKKDNAKVYQESVGSEFSVIQWIAQSLNADIYLEVDAITEGGREYDYNYGNSYYGSAKVTVKIFNPSTGELLGSVPYSSEKTFSKVSSYDAQSNALQSTIYKVLPIVQNQAKTSLAQTYAHGIRYDVLFNGANDSRLMNTFKKELETRVSSVRTLSLSATQARYAMFYFGDADDLASVMYDVAETTPGFENLDLTMLRGKSLTFSIER
ncbi:MAG: hypothetical protein P1P63_03895 [Treponemataceae bacterium]